MCILKQKLKLFWIFFTIISLVALIVCIILSVVEKNGSYVYSWLITIPLIFLSKFIYLNSFKKMYLKNNHRSKRKEIFIKFIMLHIVSNIIFILPFFIVSVVIIAVDQINTSHLFNIWVSLSLTIVFIILWISIISVFSYNTKNNNQFCDKEKTNGEI